ncbi:MAG: tetratricopeptide repeat protein [Bryobacteraceae bacterium]
MMKYAIFLAALISCHAQNISSLTTEIQRTPTSALYVQRATAYLTAGDARAALADADRALDRDALNVRALTVRGQANTKLGRYSNTITDLTGAIALAPSDASLYMARSEAYVAAGDQPRALADRNEALRLDPNIIATLERQRAAASPTPIVVPQQPPPPTPVAPAKPVVAVPPVLPTQAPASPTLITANPPKPAPATTISPVAPTSVASDTPDSHYQQAKKFLDQGKHAEAITALSEAIRLQPTNPIFFNTRGYAYYLSKDTKRAIQDYDEAIKLKPDYLNATHNRALARKTAGDAEGSAADRQREIELAKAQGVKVAK